MKLKYKNYHGTYEFFPKDKEYHGRIIGISDIIHFCAKNLKDLKKEFEFSVEDYLETCKKNNIIPEKSCSGDIRIRTTPELHANLVKKAQFKGMSLNAFIISSLQDKHDGSKVKK